MPRGRSRSEVLTTSEDLAALRPEWEALHTAVPDASPFTHPAWHAAWIGHAGAQAFPVFLAVRREEQLVGVTALDVGTPGHAATLGDPEIRDFGGPLALPGAEDETARGVLEWLGEDMTPALSLWGVREDAPMRAAFAAQCASLGWSLTEDDETVALMLALPSSFEAYVAALPKHDRHELLRKLRHLDDAGMVGLASVRGLEDVTAGLESLFALMRASHDGKRRFLTTEHEALFRDLATAFAPLGMVTLSTLTLDGTAAAKLLSFETADATYLYNSGYDPSMASLSVGLLSKAFAIREAIDGGKRMFHFLRGAEPYKAHLGGTPLRLLTLALRGR